MIRWINSFSASRECRRRTFGGRFRGWGHKEEIQTLTPKKKLSLEECGKSIVELHRREHRIWCQCARDKWLKDGDTNIAYLHMVASMRK